MNLDFVYSLVEKAGRAILDIVEGGLNAEKEGLSPLEPASGQALRIISEGLRVYSPGIPVFSKENKDAPGGDLPRFWLVDPLDGGGEGAGGSGEFTVDVALVEGDAPVWGAIYVPSREILYFAARGEGCWKIEHDVRRRLQVSAPSAGAPIRVVVNRSHISPDTVALIDLLPSSVTVGRDSALKFCAIAEGEADFYPRFEATREWETAAGQIIVAEAGAVMTDLEAKPFTYNKVGLVNGPFLVAPSLDWLARMDLLDCRKRLADWKYEVLSLSCR